MSIRIVLLTLAATTAMGSAALARDPQNADGKRPDVARTSTHIAFNIPPQALRDALAAWSSQSGLMVLSRESDDAVEITSAAVTGEYSPTEALDRMLVATGLGYQFVNARTVRIAPAVNASKPTAERQERTTSLHLAAAEPASQSDSSLGTRATDAADSKVAEVVVTAQKRAQRLQDVPISIVAMSSEELSERKIKSLDDLSMAVPGLSIQSSGSQRRIMLRGISNVFGSSSLIGLYMDEASATTDPTFQLDLRTYDLERVEVLRGPQGTLYGEGAVGGTIRFITRDPTFDSFQMNANVAATFTEKGSPGQRIETVVNTPVTDDFGLRIAGTFDHTGGWIDQPAINQKDFNGQNVVNVRAKGLWKPSSALTASAMAIVHRDDTSTNWGEDSDGNYQQLFNLETTPHVRDDYELYNFTLGYDFAQFRILNTLSYTEQDKETRQTGTKLPVFAPPVPPFDYYIPRNPIHGRYVTEELRFSSLESSPWQWTIGGFGKDAHTKSAFDPYYVGFPIAPGAPLPAPAAALASDNRAKSWAAFGDTSYELARRLTIGAGLRYFSDDQDHAAASGGVWGAERSAKFHTLNPRAYVQFKATDQINTYASAAKGFRSGGFNPLGRPNYEPEHVWTYELGTKTTLLDGALAADVAAFYSDYVDYQVVGVTVLPSGATATITSNAGEAEIKGVELGLTWRASKNWMFSLNGDYVDSKFTKVNGASGTDSTYAVGDPLDLFPKYALTASVQNNFIWNGHGGFARLDYEQNGKATYRNRNVLGIPGFSSPFFFSESDLINMLNLHVNLEWSDNLSLGLFGQNLLNDRGYIDPLSIERAATRARPRTYGIEFGVKFN